MMTISVHDTNCQTVNLSIGDLFDQRVAAVVVCSGENLLLSAALYVSLDHGGYDIIQSSLYLYHCAYHCRRQTHQSDMNVEISYLLFKAAPFVSL